MHTVVEIMLPALAACLILTGIHTYLGLHVVSRGVIFVDLALAQIAALGSTFAFLLGFDPRSGAGYLYSLGFTFVGAAIFSLSRLKDKRIPQEALIGITFAVASSTAILIADRAPQGAEHIEEMLAGAILWVRWPTIWKTLAIYSAVGLFHLIFRRQFLLISMDPEEAERRGMAVRWWDFLFYISFGFVITSSVAIAGVLLVFSFLIIPSVVGMLYSKQIGTRLVIGWTSGTLVSLAGLYCSYVFDFPSGPAVVSSFGVFLILAAVIHYVIASRHRLTALGRVAAGTGVAAALLMLAFALRPNAGHEHSGESDQLQRITDAAHSLSGEDRPDSSVYQTLSENRDSLRELVHKGQLSLDQRAVQRLAESEDASFAPVLEDVFGASEDEWLKYHAAVGRTRLGDSNGIHNLIELLSIEGPVFLKAQVIEQVKAITGSDFGYDPMKDQTANRKAINEAEVWWHQNADRITWDPSSRRFQL